MKHLILGTAGHIDHGVRGYHAPNPEHMDILRLMRVKCGLVVALTRRDMVEDEWLALVAEEIREFVAESFLEHAPIIPVSSRTGEGLEELKAVLTNLATSRGELP